MPQLAHQDNPPARADAANSYVGDTAVGFAVLFSVDALAEYFAANTAFATHARALDEATVVPSVAVTSYEAPADCQDTRTKHELKLCVARFVWVGMANRPIESSIGATRHRRRTRRCSSKFGAFQGANELYVFVRAARQTMRSRSQRRSVLEASSSCTWQSER